MLHVSNYRQLEDQKLPSVLRMTRQDVLSQRSSMFEKILCALLRRFTIFCIVMFHGTQVTYNKKA